MAEKYDELSKKLDTFQNKLDNFKIGARRFQSDISTEEQIQRLRDIDEITTAKLNTNKLRFAEKKETFQSTSEESIETLQQQLLDKLLEKKLRDKFWQTVSFSEKIQEIKTDFPDDDIVKKNILEELQKMEALSNELKNVTNRQKMLFDEKFSLQTKTRKEQVEFKRNLAERKKKYQEEKEKMLSMKYKKTLEETEARIHKLNFMRSLTVQLIVYSTVEMDKHDEFTKIIEKSYKPFTIDTFNSLKK